MSVFTIHSETHATTSGLRKLYGFLTDFKNFRSILPEDKVENFNHTEDGCSFTIKGVTPMTITLEEKHEFDYIVFQSDGLAKFNFKLKVNFIGSPEQVGQCNLELIGDLNPFIKSMVEKALVNLVNTMSLRLSQMQVQ